MVIDVTLVTFIMIILMKRFTSIVMDGQKLE